MSPPSDVRERKVLLNVFTATGWLFLWIGWGLLCLFLSVYLLFISLSFSAFFFCLSIFSLPPLNSEFLLSLSVCVCYFLVPYLGARGMCVRGWVHERVRLRVFARDSVLVFVSVCLCLCTCVFVIILVFFVCLSVHLSICLPLCLGILVIACT